MFHNKRAKLKTMGKLISHSSKGMNRKTVSVKYVHCMYNFSTKSSSHNMHFCHYSINQTMAHSKHTCHFPDCHTSIFSGKANDFAFVSLSRVSSYANDTGQIGDICVSISEMH